MSKIKPGDIVQIQDQSDAWFPCLLIVGEVKAWGVMAACLVPESNDGSKGVGQAWRRLNFEKVVKVGAAEFLVHDPNETEGAPQ